MAHHQLVEGLVSYLGHAAESLRVRRAVGPGPAIPSQASKRVGLPPFGARGICTPTIVGGHKPSV